MIDPSREPWYRAFFRGDWQRGAAEPIAPGTGEPQAQFIAQVLELTPGARVFDTVCGNGRVLRKPPPSDSRNGHRGLGVGLGKVKEKLFRIGLT